jgi:glycosyltransferase involved in cell wall biosynthesis
VTPPQRPPPRETLSAPLRATFCGTFGLTYDFELMLSAARSLHAAHPGRVTFSLVGDGPLLPSLRRRRLPPNVTLPGPLTGPALDRALAQSHVGLCCYRRGAVQSLPIKPFLYLAHGLPVASTLPGELAELLQRHQLGCTVSSAEALADFLLQLLDAPQRWRRLATAALAYGQQHALEQVTGQMADWLLGLSGMPRTRPARGC